MRHARSRVALHLARDVILGWRHGAAVQPHPHAHERIGEAVALAVYGDQIHVFEPREIVLGRPRRPSQPQRDLSQRQRFLGGEDVEDRLEGAVPARPVQPQFVARPAPVIERPTRGQESREGTDRVGAMA